MALRSCSVTFTDAEGVRHAVDVSAETLYEAAVLAMAAFRMDADAMPGPTADIAIEVRPPAVRHVVTVRQLRKWLDQPPRSPRESTMKQRLKALLSGAQKE